MISAVQVREALALLSWTPLTLAARAFLAFDDVTRALNDFDVQRLDGLQLGAIRDVLHRAAVDFLAKVGAPGVRLRDPR